MTQDPTPDEITALVRDKYAAVAAAVSARPSDTAGAGACCSPGAEPFGAGLYPASELEVLPPAAVLASLGCGNPTALAELRPGEVVLDLGSGGGIDVLLSARRVGPGGFAYGLDMTAEMLALAERNAAEQGVRNVRFLKGRIEAIPLADASVDVIISNCVVNLSADKPAVLREAARVLRPGGRFAVSDVVVQGTLPAAVRRDMELWAGCVAGALEEGEYRRLLAAAGFRDISVEVTQVYRPDDLRGAACCGESRGEPAEFAALEASGGRIVSAFVRASKPPA